MKIRINSYAIRPLCGEGDVNTWICKIKLVAKLQGIDVVTSLVALYPKRSVLALRLNVDEEDQLSAVKIEQHLKETYMKGMYAVFAKLWMVK